jgi:hypothetical protein
MMRPSSNTDGTYETKIDGNSLSQRYQSYGLLLWQDSTNFIRLEIQADPAVKTAAWRVIGGVGSNAIAQQAYTLGASNYLRVAKSGITLYGSPDGVTWTNRGSVNQPGFTVNQAGLQVGNSTATATTANFDDFKSF